MRIVPPRTRRLEAVVLGMVGVVAFSFTLPATKLALRGLQPEFVGLGRALVAAVLAAICLAITRQAWPHGRQWPRLALVGAGVVIGFPLLSALALEHLTSSHGAVIVGLLPAATAVMAVLRAGERPSPAFWLACAAGVACVLLFAVAQGAGSVSPWDLVALAAVLSAGFGYAEGAALARQLGAWQVICWALVLLFPVLLVPVLRSTRGAGTAGVDAWLGFAYVSVVSMFLGFIAWYRGLALGGTARIGQLQLVQPVLTLAWSGLLLRETVGAGTLLAALGVIASAALAQRTRVRESVRGTRTERGIDRA
jgi:drug/metabolite transporter (DMT)-like permease